MMERIIIHWTAGTGFPNNIDLEHYHYLIDQDGIVKNGICKPIDNENCQDGKYAAHTGGGNTGSIGISMCGMYGYIENKPLSSKYPLRAVQCESCWRKIAELCREYGIPVRPDTVMTHYEFGKNHPNTASAGKIDIIYLPPYPWVKKEDIGTFIRNKVKWYLQHI